MEDSILQQRVATRRWLSSTSRDLAGIMKNEKASRTEIKLALEEFQKRLDAVDKFQ